MSLSKVPENFTDVLVVGAGPAGLVTACELLRRGISCRLIDQNVPSASTAKAFMLYPRTLELLDQLDVVEEMLSRGQALYKLIAYSEGRPLVDVTLDVSDQRTCHNYMLMLPQPEIEQILLNRFEALGGQIEYRTRVQMVTQEEQGVSVILTDVTGQNHQLSASWFVCCDGTHWGLSNQPGQQLEVNAVDPWLIADARVDWNLQRDPQDNLYVFFSPESSILAFPLPETGHWRFLDVCPNLRETLSEQEVALQLTRKVREATGSESAVVHEPGWTYIFKNRPPRIPEYRIGRILVTGEELNSGIKDAFNLAWKLALVCKDVASPVLLDSYLEERESIAESAMRETQFLLQLLHVRESAARYVRDTLLTTVRHTHPFCKDLLQRTIAPFFELGVSYQQSQLFGEDWPQAQEEESAASLRPGSRLPDFLLGEASGMPSQRLFSLLKDVRHSLLIFTGRDCSEENLRTLEALAHQVQVRYGELISVYFIVPSITIQNRLHWQGAMVLDGGHPHFTLHQRFEARTASLYLIRPDGYISYRNRPADGTRLITYLKRVFANLAAVLSTTSQLSQLTILSSASQHGLGTAPSSPAAQHNLLPPVTASPQNSIVSDTRVTEQNSPIAHTPTLPQPDPTEGRSYPLSATMATPFPVGIPQDVM